MYRIGAFAGLLGVGVVATQISSSHMDATAPKPKETVATSAVVQTVGTATQLSLPPKETHVDVAKPFYTFDEATQEVTLDPKQYKRIDKDLMQLPKYKAFASGNARHTVRRPPPGKVPHLQEARLGRDSRRGQVRVRSLSLVV
jgi:hypothetical protein